MNTLGSVPEKSAVSDYYSEGVFIVDATIPTKCPILWLNAMCKEIIGEHPQHTSLLVVIKKSWLFCIPNTARQHSYCECKYHVQIG